VLDVLRPLLQSGARVYAHEFSGYWEDVGTVGSYYRSSMELLSPDPRLVLHDGRWPILTRDEERPPVRVQEGAAIEDSLVANGCHVAGTVRCSVLFPGVIVGPGAMVTDSVVMADGTVGRGAVVNRAILDKYVRVGQGAVVGEGEAPSGPVHAWLEGLTLVGKDATIPRDARIGRASVIGIGADDADFPSRLVPPGSRTPSRSWFEERA
jgi:glucose-1-phosphate adenylyltransferase